MPLHLLFVSLAFSRFLNILLLFSVSYFLLPPQDPWAEPSCSYRRSPPSLQRGREGLREASGGNEIQAMTHRGRNCIEWEATRVPGALFAPTCSTPLTFLLFLMRNLLHNDQGRRRRASSWSHWNNGRLALDFTEKMGKAKGTEKVKTVEDIQVLPHRTRGS